MVQYRHGKELITVVFLDPMAKQYKRHGKIKFWRRRLKKERHRKAIREGNRNRKSRGDKETNIYREHKICLNFFKL